MLQAFGIMEALGHHENIVQFYGACIPPDGCPMLVTEVWRRPLTSTTCATSATGFKRAEGFGRATFSDDRHDNSPCPQLKCRAF